MAQTRQSTESARGTNGSPLPLNMAAIAMRGIGQIADMQAAVTRMMLQTQARTASAFGLPDCSELFRVSDERAKRVFSESTEYVVHTAGQANETLGEVQREIGRLMESQVVNAAENLQRGFQELEAQTQESLWQLKEFAQQQVQELTQATQSLSETARETMKQGSEQLRETVRQGFERGREIVGEQSEAARRQAGQAAEEATSEHGEKGGRRGRAA